MKYKKKSHKVSIVMGSQSDYKTMKNCEKVLKILKVNYETNIVSAHRTPDRLYTYAKKAESNNISIIIAGAGGSAHLPGMIAAITRIPVIGVPIESKKLKGLDSLYFQLLNLGQLTYLQITYPLSKSIHNSLLLISRHKSRSKIPIIPWTIAISTGIVGSPNNTIPKYVRGIPNVRSGNIVNIFNK